MIALLALPAADHPALVAVPTPEATRGPFARALTVLLVQDALPLAERALREPREPSPCDLICLREAFPQRERCGGQRP